MSVHITLPYATCISWLLGPSLDSIGIAVEVTQHINQYLPRSMKEAHLTTDTPSLTSRTEAVSRRIPPHQVSGNRDHTSCHYTNMLVLQAVLYARRHFRRHVKGRRTLVCSNDSTAVAHIDHQ